MHPSAACALILALHLHSGAHVIGRASYDDVVRWVLPPDRLAAFERAGAVINEESRTSVVSDTWVTRTPQGFLRISGIAHKKVLDVPRRRARADDHRVDATLTPRNDPLPAHPIDLEDAPMADLPATALCVGTTWRTRVAVISTLGSGMATIDHTIIEAGPNGIRVDVSGEGVISGAEYNLPRLLPGHLALHGTAWFDPTAGTIVRESYSVRNRLIRTVNGKTIGFIESETVDSSAHVATPAPHG